MVFEADFAYASKTRDYDKPRTINRYIQEPENFQSKLVQCNLIKTRTLSYRIQWNNFAYFKEDFEEKKSQNRLNLSMLYRFSEQFSLAVNSNHH